MHGLTHHGNFQRLETCYSHPFFQTQTFSERPELLRNMMGLMGNVAEVKELRHQLIPHVPVFAWVPNTFTVERFHVTSCCPPTWLLPIATEINIHLCKHHFALLCIMVSPWTSPFMVQAHDRMRAWCAWLPWISRSVCAIRRPCWRTAWRQWKRSISYWNCDYRASILNTLSVKRNLSLLHGDAH